MAIIYLIGPRGVGKTSVGEKLAAALSYDTKDQDIGFYERFKDEGFLSDHIKRDAEGFFKRQFHVLKELSEDRSVISLGASNLLKDDMSEVDHEKVDFCKSKGILIMLLPCGSSDEGAKICFDRFNNRPDMGVFGNAFPPDDFEAFRKKYDLWSTYKAITDIIIYNDSSADKCVEEIISKLKEKGVGL